MGSSDVSICPKSTTFIRAEGLAGVAAAREGGTLPSSAHAMSDTSDSWLF